MVLKTLKNNFMDVQVVSTICHDVNNAWRNTSIIKRLHDNTFILVRNLVIEYENNSCYWSHAVEYDIHDLTTATQKLIQACQ